MNRSYEFSVNRYAMSPGGDIALLDADGTILDIWPNLIRPGTGSPPETDPADWTELTEESISILLDRQCTEAWLLGKRIAREVGGPLASAGLLQLDLLFSTVLDRFQVSLTEGAWATEVRRIERAVNEVSVWDSLLEGLGAGTEGVLNGENRNGGPAN